MVLGDCRERENKGPAGRALFTPFDPDGSGTISAFQVEYSWGSVENGLEEGQWTDVPN